MPTYTVENKIQYPMVAQPTMLPAPVVFMPQMVPAQIPFQPALPTLPMLPITNPVVQANNAPLFYDGSSFTTLPQNLTSVNAEGCLIPPPGFSFVTMGVPSTTSAEPSVSAERLPELDSLPLPAETTRSRSSSVVSEPPQVSETSEDTAKPAQNKKYRHRSKQKLILEIHAKLKEEYTAKGLYASDDEVLRGFDTVRVHVKTYKALNRVHLPLNDVESHPGVKVLKIATPFSMKNRFQRKGFIVYLKLASPDMVPLVREIFSNYKEDFAKCDVALKKEDKLKLDAQKKQEAAQKLPTIADETSISSAPGNFLSTRAFTNQGLDLNDWTYVSMSMAA